jgi:hypothetical protein
MPMFRKKPVVIEAVQWSGLNNNEVRDFCRPVKLQDGKLRIPTLEGHIWASPGDWIIKGVNGEFYPCKPDIFEKTYDQVP